MLYCLKEWLSQCSVLLNCPHLAGVRAVLQPCSQHWTAPGQTLHRLGPPLNDWGCPLDLHPCPLPPPHSACTDKCVTAKGAAGPVALPSNSTCLWHQYGNKSVTAELQLLTISLISKTFKDLFQSFSMFCAAKRGISVIQGGCTSRSKVAIKVSRSLFACHLKYFYWQGFFYKHLLFIIFTKIKHRTYSVFTHLGDK